MTETTTARIKGFKALRQALLDSLSALRSVDFEGCVAMERITHNAIRSIETNIYETDQWLILLSRQDQDHEIADMHDLIS